jgi:hypothetical protein
MTYFQRHTFLPKKKRKYSNRSTIYGGRTYHSIKEAHYAEELDWRKKAGEIREWIPQFKIDLKVNGIHICNYYVDFKVIDKHGAISFHEVKGFSTNEWILKWKLTQALINDIEPGAELIVIK